LQPGGHVTKLSLSSLKVAQVGQGVAINQSSLLTLLDGDDILLILNRALIDDPNFLNHRLAPTG
jgi:hypothetical protein